MPLTVACPSCSAKLKVPDEAVGRKVKCPKCTTLISIGVDEPEPPAVEPFEGVDPPDARSAARPKRRSREADAGDEPRPRSKKSNKGLIIGLVVGGVLLLSCCCVGGPAAYFGYNYAVKNVTNPKVTRENFALLKGGMTLAQVEAILGSGSPASLSDVREAYSGGGSSPPNLAAIEEGTGKGTLYRWKNGNKIILVLFNAPPKSGGIASSLAYHEGSSK